MNNLATKYGAGFTEAPDANYPLGGFKNETAPGLFNGTPFEKGWADDLNAMAQGLLNAAGIVASGTTDTILVSQILQGILYQVQTADYFVDSGAADAYVLTPLTNNYAPEAYKLGQTFRFVVNATNTGASVVDASSLGSENIKRVDGTALRAGDMTAGDTAYIYYDGTDFLLIRTTADKTKIDEGLTFETISSENAGGVTILAAFTPITSVDLSAVTDVTVGDIFDIEGFCQFTKGGTGGTSALRLVQGGGTATVKFFNSGASSGVAEGVAVGAIVTQQTRGKLQVTGAGTLVVDLEGASAGSNSTVAIGDGQMLSYTLRRQ